MENMPSGFFSNMRCLHILCYIFLDFLLYLPNHSINGPTSSSCPINNKVSPHDTLLLFIYKFPPLKAMYSMHRDP